MRCDLYNSEKEQGVRLYVREGVNPEDVVPAEELEKIKPLISNSDFKSVPFSIDEPLLGVSVQDIISNVNERGYYIHKFSVKVETTITQEPKKNISKAGAALGGGLLLASFGGGPAGALIGALGGLFLASLQEEKAQEKENDR